jgi:hypothetical protein
VDGTSTCLSALFGSSNPLRRGFNVSSPLNKTFHHIYSLDDSSNPKVETMICALLDMVSPMFFIRPAAIWSEALTMEAGRILLSMHVLLDSGPSLVEFRSWPTPCFAQSVSLSFEGWWYQTTLLKLLLLN